MIRSEWKKIFGNKMILVILCGIMTIPTLYGLIFLASLWDSYGKMNDLPVAVVNHDTKVSYMGSNLAIGDEMVKNMKKTKSLDFHFVSESEAEKGLANGDYYMILTIPRNFSDHATTLLDKTPKKMQINYKTNAGNNFIGSKFSESAVVRLKDKVSAEVAETYARTVFKELTEAGKGMNNAAKGNKKLVSGTHQATDANKKLTNGLERLTNSSLTFSNGVQTMNKGISKYVAGINQVDQGAAKLNTGIQSLAGSVGQLSQGVNKLGSGSSQLSSGIGTYVQGVGQVNNGTTQLNSGLNTLAANVAPLQTGVSKLSNGSNQLTTGLSTYTNGVTQLKDGTAALSGGMQQLNSQVPGIVTNSQKLGDGLQQLSDGSSKLNTGLTTLNDQVNSSDNNKKMEELQNTMNTLAGTIATVQDQNTKAALQKTVASLAKQLDDLKTQNQQMGTAISQLQTGAQNLNIGLQQANTQVQAANKQLPAFQTGVSKLTESSSTLASGASKLADSNSQLNQGAGALATGLNQMNSQLPSLSSGVTQLQTGSQKVSEGTQALADKGTDLQTGASQLNSGIQTLNGKLPQLSSGVQQLATGSSKLTSGTHQLASNGSALTSGVQKLSSGADQIHQGAGQLADGSGQIGSGLTKLANGNQTLADKLGKGGKKITSVSPDTKTYQMMAAPVANKHIEAANVPNNGTGMAPYMMSIGLFIGAVVLNLLYDQYKPSKYPKNSISWWASKMSVLGAIGILQAVLMYVLLVITVGLNPIDSFQTLGVLILTALAFMAIINLFNLLLDRIGAFLMLILLVLQLGGSGGTYPIQLTNGFFEAIHPYLPMTYTVHALRQTISIGGSIATDIAVLVGLIVVFNALIIGFFEIKRRGIAKADISADTSAVSD